MRTLLVVFLSLAWSVGGAMAVPADLQTAILASHNAERSLIGVADLRWDETLAAHAAVWAVHLAALGALEHSPIPTRPGEGENLWLGTVGAYTPAEMVAGWTSEKAFFHNGKFPDVAGEGDWRAVGHYTQMIWRHTHAVGCAVAASKQWDVLVCRYAPAGNTIGKQPF